MNDTRIVAVFTVIDDVMTTLNHRTIPLPVPATAMLPKGCPCVDAGSQVALPLLVVALLLLRYTVRFLFALSAPQRFSPPPAIHSTR